MTGGPLVDAVETILAADWDPGSTPPPGALVALCRRGEIAYAAGGLADSDTGAPMRWETATDAGSITKVMATTAALAALIDAGAVQLDAPAGRYLPEAAGGPAAPTTVRDLLEHRAGLWEWWPLYLRGARGADALHLAATLPPRYPAGSGRHYSDLGFILLGAVVCRVFGADLATAAGELAFDRFGLGSTRYATPFPGVPVAASSHGDAIEREMVRSGVPYPVHGNPDMFPGWRTHNLVGEVNDGNAFHAFGGVAGHAGLFTTAGDLLRLASGLLRSLRGDGPLRQETAAAFLTPGRDPGQALGLRVWRREGGLALGHGGFPGVAFALLPTWDAALVMVTNRLHANGTPRATELMWLRVLDAADDALGA